VVQNLHDKFTAVELVEEFSAFMVPEDSLPCSQNPVIRPYLEPV